MQPFFPLMFVLFPKVCYMLYKLLHPYACGKYLKCATCYYHYACRTTPKHVILRGGLILKTPSFQFFSYNLLCLCLWILVGLCYADVMKKFLTYPKSSFTTIVVCIVTCCTLVLADVSVLLRSRLSRNSVPAASQNYNFHDLLASDPPSDSATSDKLTNTDITQTSISKNNQVNFELKNNPSNHLPESSSTNDANSTNDNQDKTETDPSDDLNDESFEFPSNLIMKAVNPGYKIDGVNDVGELIELQNLSGSSLSLASFSIRYTNGTGKQTTIVNFPEGSLMTGEYLLLGYQKTGADSADLTYSSSLAMSAGPLELLYEDQVIDTVCWTGKETCVRSFKSANPTTLVRNLETGVFEHQASYESHFNSEISNLFLPPTEPDEPEPSEDDTDDQDSQQSAKDDITTSEKATPKCYQLEFNEVFSYYSGDRSEQFIEFYNPSDHTVDLAGCKIKYKNKTYPLSGKINTGGYLAYYPNNNFALTKNPTTSNSIFLLDTTGEIVEEIVYEHGQKKSASYAKFFETNGTESWRQTYTPTPNAANQFQEFRTCPAGKVINPLTGNCINATSVLDATETKDCPTGKYRNPLTGRCKNIETASTQKECAEGYERNPETNRCRKIATPNEGADYALVPNTSSSSTVFAAFGVVATIVAIGVIYILIQFRHEIIRTARKVRQRVNHVFQNFFAREVGRDRHKKP